MARMKGGVGCGSTTRKKFDVGQVKREKRGFAREKTDAGRRPCAKTSRKRRD
jgi:hypothetical protein